MAAAVGREWLTKPSDTGCVRKNGASADHKVSLSIQLHRLTKTDAFSNYTRPHSVFLSSSHGFYVKTGSKLPKYGDIPWVRRNSFKHLVEFSQDGIRGQISPRGKKLRQVHS